MSSIVRVAIPGRGLCDFTVDDPTEFRHHIRRYIRAVGGPLSRAEYERLCVDLRVPVCADRDLDPYPATCADYSADYYHTEPRNRPLALAGTLQQRRFAAVAQGSRPRLAA